MFATVYALFLAIEKISTQAAVNLCFIIPAQVCFTYGTRKGFKHETNKKG